jgi:hypothetical protein
MFSNQEIKNSKKIKLCFPTDHHYDKSVNIAVSEPLFNIQGIWVKSNPYSSFAFAKIIKGVQDV